MRFFDIVLMAYSLPVSAFLHAGHTQTVKTNDESSTLSLANYRHTPFTAPNPPRPRIRSMWKSLSLAGRVSKNLNCRTHSGGNHASDDKSAGHDTMPGGPTFRSRMNCALLVNAAA